MNTSPNVIILIAEDDEDDRLLLTQAFVRHQPEFHLRFFSDGQQLQEELSRQTGDRLPDLILLDLNMPTMDGYTTLNLLKSDAQLRAIPVAILTTSDSSQDRRQCFEAGADAFLTKPTVFSQFAKMIDQLTHLVLKNTNHPSGG